jgi:6-pyruvoyltetrahydropterin/6-carboxytetrahydropterin synthase
MQITLTHEFDLESAHHLPRVPEDHKCRRVHGHSFLIEVHVRGEVNPETGWVVDYAEIQKAFAPLHRQLDHRLLNDIEGLENPTSENLAKWIWERLAPALPGLCEIVVRESRVARCSYRGD